MSMFLMLFIFQFIFINSINLSILNSLSEGACCTDDCHLLTKVDEFICSEESDCSFSATCDGTQSSCPNAKPKSNSNTCREGTMVCFIEYSYENFWLLSISNLNETFYAEKQLQRRNYDPCWMLIHFYWKSF